MPLNWRFVTAGAEQVWQDIRFSARSLLKTPAFSMTIVLTLALGIGANTAIFSLIDSVMLRSLPVSHPEQLLQVNMGNKDVWGTKSPFFSNPVWEQLRDRQDVFSQVFAYSLSRLNLAARGEARYVQGNYVSGQFFSTLGLRPIIGRSVTTADDRRDCPATAVLSYGFWQSEYGGRAAVVGKTISLENHPFEILGVTGPGFTGIDVGRESDIYVPLCAERFINGENSNLDNRRAGWLRIIGRPKPGISTNQVEARLKTLAGPILEATLPPNLTPDRQEIYRRRTFETEGVANGHSNIRFKYGQALIVLMVIVGVVLLIACANMANLLLARSVARQHEMAIRMALGSGAGRLMRQLLTESMVLSLAGGSLAILFAHWGARVLVGLLSSNVYQENKVLLDLTIDSRVLAFTAAVAILTALLFGLAPAWRSTRVDPQSAMKANARGITDGGKFGLGKMLVVTQVALSLVLIVGAGLMLSTFFRLETLNPGFDREHILLADVALRGAEYPPARRHAIFDEMLEHLRALPGVRSASYSDWTPIGGVIAAAYLQFEGRTSKRGAATLVYFNEVSDRFFETLNTNLLAGRDFNAHDTPESSKVAIVNQTLVKKFFPGQNPIGKRYRSAGANRLGEPVEIIGVVRDAKSVDLREEIPSTVYIASSQDARINASITFELLTPASSPTSLISAVKLSIAEINPNVSLQFKTLAVQVDQSLAREKLLATLSGFFGGLALVLAMLGLYGVVSYNVTRRRTEIGIRMALGAQQSRVLRMVFREVVILVGIGLAIGLAATIGATRFIAGFLYGVKPNDPWTLSLAAAMLALVAVVAGFLPAHRASRLDPMNALREE
ncbi:MAG TPA: ABC transporter permease [Bryobacteraceae bacterium]|jgi:predicted permease|nr:ABC transporter permease [Bryobacteraceae bacterium]